MSDKSSKPSKPTEEQCANFKANFLRLELTPSSANFPVPAKMVTFYNTRRIEGVSDKDAKVELGEKYTGKPEIWNRGQFKTWKDFTDIVLQHCLYEPIKSEIESQVKAGKSAETIAKNLEEKYFVEYGDTTMRKVLKIWRKASSSPHASQTPQAVPEDIAPHAPNPSNSIEQHSTHTDTLQENRQLRHTVDELQNINNQLQTKVDTLQEKNALLEQLNTSLREQLKLENELKAARGQLPYQQAMPFEPGSPVQPRGLKRNRLGESSVSLALSSMASSSTGINPRDTLRTPTDASLSDEFFSMNQGFNPAMKGFSSQMLGYGPEMPSYSDMNAAMDDGFKPGTDQLEDLIGSEKF